MIQYFAKNNQKKIKNNYAESFLSLFNFAKCIGQI
jgi:hypothetical protein